MVADSNSISLEENRRSLAGAGLTGGGVGTILAAIAESLPDSNPLRAPLLLSAPLIAVAVSGVGLFAKTVLLDPWVRQRVGGAEVRELDRLVTEARVAYDAILNDPDASGEQREESRKIFESIQQAKLTHLEGRVGLLISAPADA